MLITDPNTGKVVIPIDASSLKHSYCTRHWQLDVIYGYVNKGGQDMSLTFGSAVHKFAESFYKTQDEATALLDCKRYWQSVPTAPAKKTKEFLNDLALLQNTCCRVAEFIRADKFKVVVDSNNTPLVEQKFAIDLIEYPDAHVRLFGTLDKIGQFGLHGAFGIGDWKTTTFYDTDKYFEGYKLDPQLLVYMYALRHFARTYPDSIWSRMYEQGIRCFIDAIVVQKNKEPHVVRSDVFEFRERDLDLLDLALHKKAEQLHTIYKERGYNELATPTGRFNGTCKTMYGVCKYFSVCAMPDEQSEHAMLSNMFEVKSYDPMNFR